MSRGSIVAVCMPERGHLQRLLSLVGALSARGQRVSVFTDAAARVEVEAAGGDLVDLFGPHPLGAADASSLPVPMRYVSFAGRYAEPVTRAIAARDPSLVLYDTFAVVAPVAARRLGVPWVNLCAGHATVPERAVAALRSDPRTAISEACWQAVQALRQEPGMQDAHPFSYVDALSPYLNVYGEPAAFLSEAQRKAFEPIAFFGALAPDRREASATGAVFREPRRAPRVYVSFGTVVWRYYAAQAEAALRVLSDVFASRDVEVVMSLGGEGRDALRATLERPNVRVEGYVDQWTALAQADLFVTHHGLNSTHEAIYHRVPMLSYPFFGDQPGLAATCQRLGVAVPLAEQPRAPLEPAFVAAALARATRERAQLAAHLATAHAWELETLAARDGVVDRILALA